MMMNQPTAQTSGGPTRAFTVSCPTLTPVRVSSESPPLSSDYMTRYTVITCRNQNQLGRSILIGDASLSATQGIQLLGVANAMNRITVSTGNPLFCMAHTVGPLILECIASLR
jgi:hypothetical protein